MTQHIRTRKESPKRKQNKTVSRVGKTQNTAVMDHPDLMTPENILQLQRQFGNKFVSNLVQRQQTTNTSETSKIQRHPFPKMLQRDDDDENLGLLNNDSMESDNSTFETFGPLEPEEKSTNPFESDEPFEMPDNDSNEPNPFDEMMNEENDKKGQNPNLKVDNMGYTGKVGKGLSLGKGVYTGYKTGDDISQLVSDTSLNKHIGKGTDYVSNKTSKGVKNLLNIKSSDNDDDTSKKGAGWWSKIKSAIATIIEGIKEGKQKGVNFFAPVMNAIGQVKDVLEDMAKYSIPFISTIVSAITGAYSVYSSWSTYQAFDIAGKEAKQLLEANEDENTNEKTSLLKDKSSSKSARYAAAKTFRAFWSKLASFGLTLGKGIAEIAALFTGGATEAIALGLSLAKSAQKAVGYAKALYKIIKGTKGKNRALHANKIMENADDGNEDSLKLLLDLGLTGDIWMGKLATKLDVKYDPTYKDYTEVLYSRFLGKVKDNVVSFGSNIGNNLAKETRSMNKEHGKKIPKKISNLIEKHFIDTDKQTALALMIEPRTTQEMHMYLQNLKEVGMYEDFAKEVMSSMKSN